MMNGYLRKFGHSSLVAEHLCLTNREEVRNLAFHWLFPDPFLGLNNEHTEFIISGVKVLFLIGNPLDT